jgi:excisionase family DNA binding protein
MSNDFEKDQSLEADGTAKRHALQLVLTIEEAAGQLRISRNSAYEAARRGEIPTIRLGRRLLVPLAALERLLEQAGRAWDKEEEGTRGR